MSHPPINRHRHEIKGVVQGVGFRPFIYKLAQRYQLGGFIYNHSQGVVVEIEGSPDRLAEFSQAILRETPPLAHIEEITTESIPVQNERAFLIRPSHRDPTAHTLLSPDMSLCDDCLREILDPTDRRYGYPFTNCTNCGPRFTIIQDIPYDRPLTTMAEFSMCAACQAEYDDPLNRRFHAQPNACADCGPRLSFAWPTDTPPSTQVDLPPLEQARHLLRAGKVVAVKGLGGFHLACDATKEGVIQRLRQQKKRNDKPFAVMASTIEQVKQFAHVTPAEEALLTSKERPIVLLRKRQGEGNLASQVAPGQATIGVMLPYTPLHHLLTADLPPLVMTSGNLANEPIISHNNEAVKRLSFLVDGFLLHDRAIHAPCDDSVVRLVQHGELPVRRSRGYAPYPVKLPFALPPILAVGGELKATFCLTNGTHAFMSPHIGDMENLETLRAFEQTVTHFQGLFRVEPQRLACDMHPAYLSTRWAKEHQEGRSLFKVQHHHAHLASVMAEHGLDGSLPVIGFAFDGTGYGTDGAIWGGEVMVVDYRHYRRVAHLRYVPLPGGDAAIRRPYRLALAYLWAAGIEWAEALPCVAASTEVERKVLRRQVERHINTTPTSSMGRLFDAVAALLGVRQTVSYEGQAAMELEALVDPTETGHYRLEVTRSMEIETAPLLRAILKDRRAGVSVERVAAKFHQTIAEWVVQWSLRLRHTERINRVALSGGVFQNVTLLERTINRLTEHHFEVLTHRLVPPNDGGLALGQAVIAGLSR